VRPYLEKAFRKKRVGGVAQGVGLEFKPQYCKKKKERKKRKTKGTSQARQGGAHL
jgi:hypothetical protein